MAAYVDASSVDCASSHLSQPVATSDAQLPVHDGSIATAMIALDLADLSAQQVSNRSAARRWVVEILENFVKKSGTPCVGH